MTEQQTKPRRFNPDNRATVALSAAAVVWIVLFLVLVLFTSLAASTSALVAFAFSVVVFLTGLGFHFTAALYAMVLEAGYAALAAITAVLAAILSAFS